MRWMQKWCDFSMLVVYHLICFTPPICMIWFHSPYWHDMVKTINEAPKGYKSPNYEKARTVLLDREITKFQRALRRFTDEWGDFGVFIVTNGWTNIRNLYLINILGVSTTGAMFLAVHDSSSIIAFAQNILEFL